MAGAANDFNGTLDDVMIFSRSLSAEEIAALYANQSSKYASQNFTDLAGGTYRFTGYAQDTAGNVNSTGEWSVTITNLTECTTLDRENTTYVLQNDLTTNGDCLRVQANNITVDMNGYNISGDGEAFDYGVTIGSGYNYTTIKDGFIYGFHTGIAEVGNNNNGNFTNLTINLTSTTVQVTGTMGIYINGNNNYITNCNISTDNPAMAGPDAWKNGYGIYISGSDNVIENNTLHDNKGYNAGYGIYLSGGSDNNITDTNITNSDTSDVYLTSSSTDNIFLNCSYETEGVDSGSSLIREWYYRAQVNATGGDDISDAYVEAYNSSDDLIENLTTTSDGQTPIGSLIEYVNSSGTTYYYSNYTINASHPDFLTGSNTHNVTVERNIMNDAFALVQRTKCGTFAEENKVYIFNNSIDTDTTCIIIGANNITLDLNGFYIDGDGGSDDYGIHNPTPTPTSTGLTLPGSGSNDISLYNGDIAWVDTDKITTGGSEDADCLAMPDNDRSDALRAYNFGFGASVPADATITGIYVEISHRGDDDNDIEEQQVYLVDKNGNRASGCANKANSADWDDSWELYTYGGAGDMWSTSLDASDIRDSDFGVYLVVESEKTTSDAEVRWVKMNVYYTIPGSYSDTTVMNGTISDFGRGISNSGDDGSFSDLYTSSNTYAIYLDSSSGSNITNISAEDDIYGIYLDSSSGSNIKNISADVPIGVGVALDSSSGNTITDAAIDTDGWGIGIDISASSNNILTGITANSNWFGISLGASSDNNVLTDITASSNNAHGFYIASSSNSILTNINASSNGDEGFFFTSSPNNILTNINASSNGYQGGIYFLSSPNNTLTNITANSNAHGLFFQTSPDNTLTNIVANENTGVLESSGLYIISSSHNNVITNVTANSNDMGITLFSSSNNIVTNTSMRDCANDGVNYYSCLNIWASHNNTVSGGVVNSSALYLLYVWESENSTFTDLTLINATANAVLVEVNSINNTFEDLTIQNTTMTAFNITSSNDNSIINNTFSETPWDYYVYDSTVLEYGLNGSSLEIENTDGSLKFLNTSLYAWGSNLSSVISITQNNIFVNSSFSPGFNTTANVTLNSIPFYPTKIVADWDDDGVFEDCPSTVCTNLSYNDTTGAFAFNVTRFTSYKASGTGVFTCGVLNVPDTYQILQNDVSTDTTCFNITANNVTLDCAGYNITGALNGIGVSAESAPDITVRDCQITNFSGAVHLYSVNTSLFDNLTIFSNDKGQFTGIFANQSNSNNFTSSNLSYNNASENSGIYLYDSDSNRIEDSTFKYNNVSASGIINGGGILGLYSNSDYNQFTNTTISNNNMASNNDIEGGGIITPSQTSR
jgi:parallel beta-helix repeat protein